ncbi:MAG: N-acetylneuraminate synthase family protein [Planctomycetia bacterium]|nr:N-acetylneuraminate synthase family protein [Planctomycetia bacterium]
MHGNSLRINARRSIGPGSPTFVVAELGQNHNGSRELAEQLVDAAAWAGADAVKLVKRHLPSELTKASRNRRYDSAHSFGDTYGAHRSVLELSVETHLALAARTRSHGMHFVVTVCDVASAREFANAEVDAFKIASRDLNNLPLVRFVAELGKPLILSTGMSSWSEIDAAMTVAAEARCPTAVLQCTSLYPTPDDQAHLRSIETLRRRYDSVVGFSDHTTGTLIATSAVALGASIIEKHLTLDRTLKGTDHACSAEPEELRTLIEQIRRIELALGSAEKPAIAEVEPTRNKLGRSLVTVRSLPAGTVLEESMFTLKSPGDGIAWTQRETIVGRRLLRDIDADETIYRSDVQ